MSSTLSKLEVKLEMKSLNINTAKHNNNNGSAKKQKHLPKIFLIQNSSVISPIVLPSPSMKSANEPSTKSRFLQRFPYASLLKGESYGKQVREYSILIKMHFLAFPVATQGKYVCHSTASIKFHPDI